MTMKITIRDHHVTSVSVDDGSVSVRAEYRDGPYRLEADITIPLMIGCDVDYEAQIRDATRTAISGAVKKLQAVVDARCQSAEEDSESAKFERVPVGEKIEAGPEIVDTAAEAPFENEAGQAWRAAYEPVYQKLFHDMRVSVPARLTMPALEDKIREIVDGRTSLARNLEGAPGWIIGGVPITLEGVLQRSDRAFESLVRGVVMTR